MQIISSPLTFTTLWANSADDNLLIYIYFLFFPTKQDLTFHANCLHLRQFARNVITCFAGKNKKSTSSLKIVHRVKSVKIFMLHTMIL